jgi:hypothetical protein
VLDFTNGYDEPWIKEGLLSFADELDKYITTWPNQIDPKLKEGVLRFTTTLVSAPVANVPTSVSINPPVPVTANAIGLPSDAPVYAVPLDASSSQTLPMDGQMLPMVKAVSIEDEIQRRMEKEKKELEEKALEKEKKIREEMKQLFDAAEQESEEAKKRLEKAQHTHEQYVKRRKKELESARAVERTLAETKLAESQAKLDEKQAELDDKKSQLSRFASQSSLVASAAAAGLSSPSLKTWYHNIFDKTFNAYNDLYQKKLIQLSSIPAPKPKKKAAVDPNAHLKPVGFAFLNQNGHWQDIDVNLHPGDILLDAWKTKSAGDTFAYSLNGNDYEVTMTSNGFDQKNKQTSVLRDIRPYYGSSPTNDNSHFDFGKPGDTPPSSSSSSKNQLTKEQIHDELLFGDCPNHFDVKTMLCELAQYNFLGGRDLSCENRTHALTSDPTVVAFAKMVELLSSFSNKFKYITPDGKTKCSIYLKSSYLASWLDKAQREGFEYARVTFHGSKRECYDVLADNGTSNFKWSKTGSNASSRGDGLYQSLSDEIAMQYNAHFGSDPPGTFIVLLMLTPQKLNDCFTHGKSHLDYVCNKTYKTFYLNDTGGRVKHHYTGNKTPHNAIVAHQMELALPLGLAYPC